MELQTKSEISLEVLGRNLSVMASADEADGLRDAVQLIEQKVAGYRSAYDLTDESYLLLMCCLELATESASTRRDYARRSQQLADRFTTIDSLLARTLSHLQPAGQPLA
jgi:cell division protein ZapA (FtsZ GTPase activity inhibitor)